MLTKKVPSGENSIFNYDNINKKFIIKGEDVSDDDNDEEDSDEEELWLIKLPGNVNKSDFKGLTIKLPEEDKDSDESDDGDESVNDSGANGVNGSGGSDSKFNIKSVAKFKKTISGDEYSLKKEQYEFEVFQLLSSSRDDSDDDDYNNIEDNYQEDNLNGISNSNNQITLSNHKLALKTMKEFEILLPNPKGTDGGLTLSKRKPDRYFNVQLNYNLSNTKNKINNGVDKEGKSDNMLSKIPEHPPEIYIERKIVTPYQEIKQEYMKCYEAEHNKYLEKLENKWKISRWNKKFKKHLKEEKKEMKKWRKEFQNAVMNSQKEFYEKLGELKLEGKEVKKEVKKEEEDDTNTWLENLKRKLDDDDDANDDDDGFEQLLNLKKNQEKKRVRKEKEEQTKALETWRLEYSGLPRYKPPETWWAKNRDKIMKEAMKKIPPKKQN